MKTCRDNFDILAQTSRPFLNDFQDPRVTVGSRFEDNWSQHRDFHFISGLRPANEFVQVVQGKGLQNFCRELHFAAMQIVFTQNEAQGLNREEISAAGIAQNMPPPSCVLDLVAATPGDG